MALTVSFENSLRMAARRADTAVNRAMEKYRLGLVTDEDDLTGVLVGNLDTELEGKIGGLTWTTSILRHRRGVASEEGAIGADIVIHVSLKTPTQNYSKGVLVQAKRIEPHRKMDKKGHGKLIKQCGKMLSVLKSGSQKTWVKNFAAGTL